jgi:hypothetical protein
MRNVLSSLVAVKPYGTLTTVPYSTMSSGYRVNIKKFISTTCVNKEQWIGCASPLPTPSVVPHSQFNHASAREALKQQIKSFGAIRTSATIKTSKCSYKVALKHAALCKTLTAAFATRGAHNSACLTLDSVGGSDVESHWLSDNNSNPMDSLEAEDYTTTTLKEIYAKLTPNQVLVAELLSDGKSQREIASILDVISNQSVAGYVSQIRARLER